MSTRKAGYYWVCPKVGIVEMWRIAYWDGVSTFRFEGMDLTEDAWYKIIEERIPSPDEIKHQRISERINDPIHRVAHENWKSIQGRHDLSDHDKKRIPWDFDTYMRIYHTEDIGDIAANRLIELRSEWVRYCTYCGY